jgi:hypothetical protein
MFVSTIRIFKFASLVAVVAPAAAKVVEGIYLERRTVFLASILLA